MVLHFNMHFQSITKVSEHRHTVGILQPQLKVACNEPLLLLCTGSDAFTFDVMLATDPFQPFKDDSGYSIVPFLMVLMNAPHQLRWEFGLCTVLGLIPGKRGNAPKVSVVITNNA
jgi:hypothetical protein